MSSAGRALHGHTTVLNQVSAWSVSGCISDGLGELIVHRDASLLVGQTPLAREECEESTCLCSCSVFSCNYDPVCSRFLRSTYATQVTKACSFNGPGTTMQWNGQKSAFFLQRSLKLPSVGRSRVPLQSQESRPFAVGTLPPVVIANGAHVQRSIDILSRCDKYVSR